MTGIGAQAKALERLGVPFEHYRICEFDKYAVMSYNAIHGTNFKTSDIRDLKGADLGVVETDRFTYIMTYSFPCFTADSLVLTENGYKRISEVDVGDKVLTHDNTYQDVLQRFDNGKKPILRISAMCADEIKCTPNHRFYVRTTARVGHYGKRVFSEPIWKSADELTGKDYLGVAVNQNAIIPKWNGIDYVWEDGRKPRHKNELQPMFGNYDFWWIIGRYIGDGWIRQQGGIIICCALREEEELRQRIERVFSCNVVRERSIYKIHIPLKELSEFVSQFGRGAANKHLTSTILDLPRELLKGFLDGYMSADGCYTSGLYKAQSVSRELIYGIAQCVAKVFRVPYRIYKCQRSPQSIIEGRVINQKVAWSIVYKLETKRQDHAIYENGYIWFPIRKIEPFGEENVYDIMVENNHSFTVQNVIVHNCTDLSVAGKQAGMRKGGGTRSGLLWEVERLLRELTELPQILLMENVPQVIGKKNIKDFAEWVAFLDALGYTSKWAVLNATDFNVPQNRERCFMVSWLGDHSYHFPQGDGCKRALKDVLEKNVDEKYYLSDKAVKYIHSPKRHNDIAVLDETSPIAPTAITAKGNQSWTGNFIADSVTPRDSAKRSGQAEGKVMTDTVGILLSNCGRTIEKELTVATPCMARDYKGFGNQAQTGVIEVWQKK